jgi:hypothetical protein
MSQKMMLLISPSNKGITTTAMPTSLVAVVGTAGLIGWPNSWKEAWSSNIQEFTDHWHDFFTDIYKNEENSVLDVILLSVELPFTIARKVCVCVCLFVDVNNILSSVPL